ncbi:MAG: hypothetical protein AABX34_00040 [Nanoarchaeota archaeon]
MKQNGGIKITTINELERAEQIWSKVRGVRLQLDEIWEAGQDLEAALAREILARETERLEQNISAYVTSDEAVVKQEMEQRKLADARCIISALIDEVNNLKNAYVAVNRNTYAVKIPETETLDRHYMDLGGRLRDLSNKMTDKEHHIVDIVDYGLSKNAKRILSQVVEIHSHLSYKLPPLRPTPGIWPDWESYLSDKTNKLLQHIDSYVLSEDAVAKKAEGNGDIVEAYCVADLLCKAAYPLETAYRAKREVPNPFEQRLTELDTYSRSLWRKASPENRDDIKRVIRNVDALMYPNPRGSAF